MEQKTIEQIVESINSLLRSPKLVGAEEWMDLAMDLQMIRHLESKQRLALKIIAAKKLKEIRPQFKSKVDAEVEWNTTEEWKNWQEKEDLFDNLDRFERIARNESQIRRNNTF